MEKKLTLNEVEGLYLDLVKDWENEIKNIKLSTRSLYRLICLKKKLQEYHSKSQETVALIFQKNEAKQTENGGLKIDDDKLPEVQKELRSLGEQEVILNFDEIILSEDDCIPANIMEAIFDFVKFE